MYGRGSRFSLCVMYGRGSRSHYVSFMVEAVDLCPTVLRQYCWDFLRQIYLMNFVGTLFKKSLASFRLTTFSFPTEIKKKIYSPLVQGLSHVLPACL